ncbi:hypothetical protein [Budvicia aquatica]|uniref:hypothetical protein n=1 Tax=Budvicia aquatica TaxID=82979 RepID=UPI00106BFDE0|nr:hypothetical protein [Budvicia aquatica]
MTLFIANCSPLTRVFTYRLPGAVNATSLRIPPCDQIVIEGLPGDIASVIKQHSMYGLVDIKTISSTEKFAGFATQSTKRLIWQA